MEHKNLNSYLRVILGLVICTLTFDLFLSPIKLVIGGTNGLSILLGEIFNISPSTILSIVYVIMIIINFIFYGFNDTKKLLFCSILYPLFIKLFEGIPNIITLDYSNKFLFYLIYSILYGIGSGLIFKEGFLGGGLDVVKKILSDKLKMPMGSAIFIVDVILIVSGGFIFGLESILYAIIILYISSNVTDRIILGVSNKKMFYIMTTSSDKVCDYIKNTLHTGVSEIDAIGGYNSKKMDVLLTVISTSDYIKLKKYINEIDSDAFYIITDCYYTYHKKGVKYGINCN